MRCFKLLPLLVSFLLCLPALAQSKKEVKTYKIKSTTEWATEMVNGKEVTYKCSYIVFDKEGRVTDRTEYNPDGTVKKRETTKYDLDGNKIEECDYNGAGKLQKKIVSAYNAEGNKTQELVYNAEGKLTKKSVYSYDQNGLKTEKRTYDGAGKLIEVKKFVYQY